MEAWKKNVISRLREYDDLCRTKEQVEKALATLSPEDRMVLQLMVISPAKGNSERLCNVLGCEISTVYRRRNKALQNFYDGLLGG